MLQVGQAASPTIMAGEKATETVGVPGCPPSARGSHRRLTMAPSIPAGADLDGPCSPAVPMHRKTPGSSSGTQCENGIVPDFRKLGRRRLSVALAMAALEASALVDL
jgi:hypothetical protein